MRRFQVRVRDDYSLELVDVVQSDQGQYSCQLDVFGQTQTALHNLTVLGENMSIVKTELQQRFYEDYVSLWTG